MVFRLSVIEVWILPVGLVSFMKVLTVTMGRTSLPSRMIDSMNWSGVRWDTQGCEGKGYSRVSSEDGMDLR